MAYEVRVVCDKCGGGFYWTNSSVSKSEATRIARKKGWQIGKRGWVCPDCKKRKDEKK